MRKRVITVPKDKEAMEALDFDIATKSQLIERIIEEEDFIYMYEGGLIQLINKKGDTNIDDFEDDSVTTKENLKRVIQALGSKTEKETDTQRKLIKGLLELFEEALNRDTGVFFYF